MELRVSRARFASRSLAYNHLALSPASCRSAWGATNEGVRLHVVRHHRPVPELANAAGAARGARGPAPAAGLADRRGGPCRGGSDYWAGDLGALEPIAGRPGRGAGAIAHRHDRGSVLD